MKKTAQFIFLLLAFSVAIFIVVKLNVAMWFVKESPTITPTKDPLVNDLSDLISRYVNNETPYIDISEITPFSWDLLYLVEPYTQPSEIDSLVGNSWRQKCSTKIHYSDSYTLLIFKEDNNVIRCFDYPREKGYFAIPPGKYEQGFSPQEALFTLNMDGQLYWVSSK